MVTNATGVGVHIATRCRAAGLSGRGRDATDLEGAINTASWVPEKTHENFWLDFWNDHSLSVIILWVGL